MLHGLTLKESDLPDIFGDAAEFGLVEEVHAVQRLFNLNAFLSWEPLKCLLKYNAHL